MGRRLQGAPVTTRRLSKSSLLGMTDLVVFNAARPVRSLRPQQSGTYAIETRLGIDLTDFAFIRYEKEFDGVQDVFELQVPLSRIIFPLRRVGG